MVVGQLVLVVEQLLAQQVLVLVQEHFLQLVVEAEVLPQQEQELQEQELQEQELQEQEQVLQEQQLEVQELQEQQLQVQALLVQVLLMLVDLQQSLP